MANCSNCGNRLDVKSMYCNECGAELEQTAIAVEENTKPFTTRMTGVVVFIGIIAVFLIMAFGTINENTQKANILADALAVENASKLYCSATSCMEGLELTWTQLQDYILFLDAEHYDLTNNGGIISTYVNGSWIVDLEASGVGELEFIQGIVPSSQDRSSVIEDVD